MLNSLSSFGDYSTRTYPQSPNGIEIISINYLTLKEDSLIH